MSKNVAIVDSDGGRIFIGVLDDGTLIGLPDAGQTAVQCGIGKNGVAVRGSRDEFAHSVFIFKDDAC